MTSPQDRLTAAGLHLPDPVKLPEGLNLPFAMINVQGKRALFSGHPRHAADGALDGPYGVLGKDMTTQEGHAAARQIALCVLANLRAKIGDLDRVAGVTRVFGMVTSAPGYHEQHLVVNGFSEVLLTAFGPDAGRHARSAIGVASLPMGFAMEIEGEVLLR